MMMSNVLEMPADMLPRTVTEEVARMKRMVDHLHDIAFCEPNVRERARLSDNYVMAKLEMEVRIRRITHPRLVLKHCSIAHDQPLDEVMSSCRSQRLAVVRYHAAWLMRRVAPGIWSLPVIAKAIGRADHSTAFHAVQTFDPVKCAVAVRVVDEELMAEFRQRERDKEAAKTLQIEPVRPNADREKYAWFVG
jgi:chromosomal replication initiation ATPase DnaA